LTTLIGVDVFSGISVAVTGGKFVFVGKDIGVAVKGIGVGVELIITGVGL
jgi:hypothetical protein